MPRRSLTWLGQASPRFADRYMIYGQALIGGISTTAQGNRRDNNLAGAFGGGLHTGLAGEKQRTVIFRRNGRSGSMLTI